MDIKEELLNVKEKVETILKEYPDAREGDPLMTILLVWRDYDGLPDWIVQQILNYNTPAHKLTSIETIRRMRQKLQNEIDPRNLGPCEDTAQQRAERAQEIRENINNGNI